MPRTVRAFKRRYVLNCSASTNTQDDWTFEDALDAGVIDLSTKVPLAKDLRSDWWGIDDQGKTGACVGYATAYGLLRWLYTKNGLLQKTSGPNNRPSARFVWMANKETDELTNHPTSFIETAGTQTKLALKVIRKFGCVTEDTLPMSGRLSNMQSAAFYTLASQFRIRSFHNLGKNTDNWKVWIATQGPILTRLDVDETWYQASRNAGKLVEYKQNTARGGHAVCLVGYSKKGFIVRNSWGKDWGDKGFAYATNSYSEAAFTEAYGAVL